MKLVIEKKDGTRRTFENVTVFQQFPDLSSSRVVIYVTSVENNTETTEKLEFWETIEVEMWQ